MKMMAIENDIELLNPQVHENLAVIPLKTEKKPYENTCKLH